MQFNDTYIFNPETNHFSLLESHPELDIRTTHRVAYVEQTNQLFMYGGSKFAIPAVFYFDELWMLDTNDANSNETATSFNETGTNSNVPTFTSTDIDPGKLLNQLNSS